MLLARSGKHRPADFGARVIFWAPLFVCGLIFVLLFSGRRGVKWQRPRIGRNEGPTPVRGANRSRAARQRLMRLRDAIIGNGREGIERLLGPPPAVAGSRECPTWYYPLDPVHRRVIAIEFEGTIARDAQFVDAPRRRRS